MRITFKKDNNGIMTYYENGDININPKFVVEFGYIESITELEPKEFVFDGKGVVAAINIEKR